MAEAEAEWAPKQDMSLLCRVCANQHDYLIPIFQGEGLDHEMPTKMGKHLPIKVRATDKLPTQMCYQCASTIIAWSELHTNCLAADKKLKGMLKKDGVVEDDNAASDHYEDAFDDGGGAQDDDDEEDFEKEIKQLISDAGVELGSNKEVKRAPRVPVTRKRKAEVTITPVVKKEPKKLKTEPLPAKSGASKSTSAKSNASASKTSTALVKPKEEVVPNEERCQENEKMFACHPCGKQYFCKRLIIKHIRKQHSILINSLRCDLCPIKFENQFHLRNHRFKVHSDQVVQFQCKQCEKVLGSKRGLLIHERRKHMLDQPESRETLVSARVYQNGRLMYKCSTCDVVVTTGKSLRNHLLVHTGEKPCTCEKCGKQFRTITQLHQHDRGVHLGLRRCNVCCQSIPAVSLRHHHHEMHKGYMCDICGKSFTRQASLSQHRLLHMEQAKLACPVCHKKFFYKKQLRRHLTIHEEKPRIYMCDVCQKSFKTNHDMHRHKACHSDERPFSCDICHSSYKLAKHLKSHAKTHLKYLNQVKKEKEEGNSKTPFKLEMSCLS